MTEIYFGVKEFEELVDTCRCPITLQVMRHPVIASDGKTYEYAFIKKILDSTKLSPITREILTDIVYINESLKSVIMLVTSLSKNIKDDQYDNYELNIINKKKIINNIDSVIDHFSGRYTRSNSLSNEYLSRELNDDISLSDVSDASNFSRSPITNIILSNNISASISN